jgi:hypothetical protein
MNRIEKWILQQKEFALQPVSTNWLGIFRICFFSYLLLMWFYHYEYKELLIGEFWKYTYTTNTIKVVLLCWLVSLVGLVTGTFTKVNAIINYICVVLVSDISKQSYIGSYFDDLMKTVSFLAIFTPIHNSYSVDKLIFKLKSQTINLTYITYLICTLGLIYTASGICKLFSMVWLNGLGIWLPLSLPHMSWNRLPEFIVDQKWMMFGMNYLVMTWELFFIPLVLWQRTRNITLVFGLIFQLSIVFLFFLPKTALGVITLYLLFLPYLNNYHLAIQTRTSKPNLYTKALYGVLILYTGLQVFISARYVNYMVNRGFKFEANHTKPIVHRKIQLKFHSLTHSFLGINSRNMFTDKSLLKQNQWVGVVRLTNNGEEWLPWIDKAGLFSSDFTLNGGWSKIMQRVLWSEESLDSGKVVRILDERGFEKALRFWMQENNVSDSNIHFKFYTRICEVPTAFEIGFLVKQKNIPWQILGKGSFVNGQFNSTLTSDIEGY